MENLAAISRRLQAKMQSTIFGLSAIERSKTLISDSTDRANGGAYLGKLQR
jgi:hypothetical protein